MRTDERTAAIMRGQAGPRVEHQAEWRDMRARRVVGAGDHRQHRNEEAAVNNQADMPAHIIAAVCP
jgi:hypothetical protein